MSKGLAFIADDDAAIRTVVSQALSRAGFEVRVTSNLATLWRWVSAGEGDLVVTDVMMPDGDAFEYLPKFRRSRPELPVIIMSAQNTFMTAIRASEFGAYEYLPKPFDLQQLIAIAERAVDEPRNGHADVEAVARPLDMPLVGRSAAMQDVYRVLARLMQTDLTLLISGESGTGKELVARALHEYGKRKNGPFVAINMAAIPKDLIESELFGHEKGAFTSAVKQRLGKFEQAHGGTLFMDEIGDMSLSAQAKVLRALQEKKITRVGGEKDIEVDVRIIAATNKDLRAEIDAGRFREDLYHRLAVIIIPNPSLNDRREDIPMLIDHFNRLISDEYGISTKPVSPEAVAALKELNWTGNIRELRNVVERLIILSGESIEAADVRDFVLPSSAGARETLSSLLARFDDLQALQAHIEQAFHNARNTALQD